ncbi:MAG: cell envelope integrity protein TolA [Panacagrimonas sp.]
MLFNSRHVLSAAALHGLLFLILVIGVRCQPKIEPPPVIEALVVTGQNKQGKLKTEPPPPPPPQPAEEPKPEPPKPEPPKPEPPKPEPPKPDPAIEQRKAEEAKRKAEQEKVKREEDIKRQAEIQLKKAEEEKKKKEEQDAKRKAEEEEKRKKAEEERIRKEEERKRIEDEKRKIEEEKKRQEDLRRQLQQQMEDQLRQEADDRAEAARIGEVKKTWAQLLNEHIRTRWLRPPGLPPGLRCKVRIEILPNGEVISVKIVQSSGNPSFDNSVENAVYKSSPLPLPEDPKAFERVLEPTFTPESLS